MDEEFGVWPENLAAVNAFIALGTQWRVGFSGVTGLDYSVLVSVFGLVGIPSDQHADAFECIRTMESQALLLMRKKNG